VPPSCEVDALVTGQLKAAARFENHHFPTTV
jgi:hypothetical protein